MNQNICPKCGASVGSTDKFCISCGAKLSSDSNAGDLENIITEFEAINNEVKPKRKRKSGRIVAIVVAVLLIAGIGIGKYLYDDYMFAENFNNAYNAMIDGDVAAENACIKIHDVWANAIWQTEDSETDAYTRPNGVWVDDFNDALESLYADEDFSAEIGELVVSQDEVRRYMQSIRKHPSKYNEEYDAIKKFYDDYLELTNLAIQHFGSLNSFTETFELTEKNIVDDYNKLQTYLQ